MNSHKEREELMGGANGGRSGHDDVEKKLGPLRGNCYDCFFPACANCVLVVCYNVCIILYHAETFLYM